jgi:hypothetical protein
LTAGIRVMALLAAALFASALYAESPPARKDSAAAPADTAGVMEGTGAPGETPGEAGPGSGTASAELVLEGCPRPEPPFQPGEKLTYSVKYEFVKAGEATIEVEDLMELEGRPVYRFATTAKSTLPFSLIFEVEDRVESLFDAEHLYSLRYEKNLREGTYEKHEVVVFDQEHNVAIYPGGKEVPLEPGALDVLSSLFYVRLLDLKVGESVFIENHADGKNYSLEIRILREETVEVPAGTFDCFVAEPILKAAGIFQHKGRLTVWLAKEYNHIPVKMESKIVIGAIKALLIRMDLGRGGDNE